MDSPTTGPFSPARLGPLHLRNRLIKCATFEVMTPDALVTDELIEFHREVAAGGVVLAMPVALACAICLSAPRRAAPHPAEPDESAREPDESVAPGRRARPNRLARGVSGVGIGWGVRRRRPPLTH